MKKSERIAALEQRVKELEAEVLTLNVRLNLAQQQKSLERAIEKYTPAPAPVWPNISPPIWLAPTRPPTWYEWRAPIEVTCQNAGDLYS